MWKPEEKMQPLTMHEIVTENRGRSRSNGYNDRVKVNNKSKLRGRSQFRETSEYFHCGEEMSHQKKFLALKKRSLKTKIKRMRRILQ